MMRARNIQKRGWRPPIRAPVLCNSKTCCSCAGASAASFTWNPVILHFLEKATYMNHMLQVVHVLVVGGDVEDGSDRFCELDGKLLGSGAKSDRWVETASVTSVVVPLHFVEADKESSTIVVHHVHTYVDVRFVAVIYPTH